MPTATASPFELDLEKETVKQVLRSAKKYGKRVYAVISNMSIAMERRDFYSRSTVFVCNQQEGDAFLRRLRPPCPPPP